MFGTSIFFVTLATAAASFGQQTTTPTTPPAATVPVTPLPPLIQRIDPLVSAFRARNSLRNGINSSYLPPQSIFYIDSYQKGEQTSCCLVKEAGRTQSAESFWQAHPNSQPETRYLADWARRAKGCYAAGFAVPRSLLRGALAEAKISQNTAPTASTPATSQQLTAFYVTEAERRRASDGADRTMSAFASCVAPLAQPQMTELLTTRHGSKEERRAMNRVLANGASCIAGDWHLPEGGGTSFLRAYLAEASFRWDRFRAA